MPWPFRSHLPESLQVALSKLGAGLRQGRVVGRDLYDIIAQFDGLAPHLAISAAPEIAGYADLHRYRPRSWRDSVPFLKVPSDKELLLRNPDLKYIFIFHHDGRLRELALNRFYDGLSSSFFVSALVYRTNDWVPQVRAAAARCLERVLARTDADIAATALIFLLDRMWRWQRWIEESAVIDAALGRADVAACMAEKFRTEKTGPMGRLLGRALRQPAFDAHLLTLSQAALMPNVRAIALNILIEGKASWQTGWTYEWTDKVFGLGRTVPVYETRDIGVSIQREALLAQGARDRGAVVRRTAADAAIKYRTTLGNLDEIVRLLANDKSRAVRERIAFIQRKLAGEPSQP